VLGGGGDVLILLDISQLLQLLELMVPALLEMLYLNISKGDIGEVKEELMNIGLFVLVGEVTLLFSCSMMVKVEMVLCLESIVGCDLVVLWYSFLWH